MKLHIQLKSLNFIALTFFITFQLFFTNSVSAHSVRLSQIDPSGLLLNQKVHLYVSVTNKNGIPIQGLTKDNFELYESSKNSLFTKVPEILNFKTMVNYESGINFLLMIDNSGSMYRFMRNKNNQFVTYIDNARQAIKTFLKHMNNPKDRVSLVSYNAYYTEHAIQVSDKSKLYPLLDNIKRPKGVAGYTELYAGLYKAVDSFKSIKGRKVIIVLSDGENRPVYSFTKKLHRQYGNKIYTYSEPLTFCQKEGISVFVINYGQGLYDNDRMLQYIAKQTGGAVFNARNSSELTNVYSTIVNQVLHEYMLTYKATMIPADKRYIKVEYKKQNITAAATRFYFASTVFGIPLKDLTPLLLYALILAFILLWLLSKISFEQKPHDANLAILNEGDAHAVNKLLSLNTTGNCKTIIGSSKNADMTLVGNLTKVKEKHATIMYHDKSKKYTLMSDADLRINNKKVKSKILESGDVINVEGTTIVFDDGSV